MRVAAINRNEPSFIEDFPIVSKYIDEYEAF